MKGGRLVRQRSRLCEWAWVGMFAASLCAPGAARAQESKQRATSYMPVDIKDTFATIRSKMEAAKPGVEARQKKLLEERYDLSDRPAKDAKMSGGKKPLQ